MIRKSLGHLHKVEENYFQHMGFALKFSLLMIAGGLGGFIHALIPAIFQTTASATIRTLYKEMEDRIARQTGEHD